MLLERVGKAAFENGGGPLKYPCASGEARARMLDAWRAARLSAAGSARTNPNVAEEVRVYGAAARQSPAMARLTEHSRRPQPAANHCSSCCCTSASRVKRRQRAASNAGGGRVCGAHKRGTVTCHTQSTVTVCHCSVTTCLQQRNGVVTFFLPCDRSSTSSAVATLMNNHERGILNRNWGDFAFLALVHAYPLPLFSPRARP